MSDEEPGNETVFDGARAPVTTYMTDEVVTVPSTATLREIAEAIVDQTIGCVVVGTVELVEGVVSERDIARAVATGADLDQVTAADVESSSLVWADVDATIGGVALEMMEGYVRHVLIGDGERLVGIVSMRDVVVAFAAL
jgi:CBS domain-containing protein